jgi:valyl-tRNA synthetase
MSTETSMETEALIGMPTRYDASLVEKKWYRRWEEAGLFSPDSDSTKPVFCITIPPPNITGSLHMGHALCYPLQDCLGRYRRLLGDRVLILPGQDHAGIATQSVVDKQLRKEGLSAAKLGREKFIDRVWEWRAESGDTILRQFREFGCAFDWTRSRFTLDEAYASAVLKVFINWFERGLIFRGKRVVNWDPKLKTSVSDIETLRQVSRGKLYHIRYPFADGSGFVTIATTRPETMLADVAVAVHPSDERYVGLVGKNLALPLQNREIPLIADIYPDPNFGTGAVKITPAHDANDYQVGIRHGLEMPVILDQDARISAEGPYFGLDRREAREAIVRDLEEAGFLEKIEDHELALIISDRSGEVIEPLLSEQWFCDQPRLAEPVIAAVKAGEIAFHPPRYERIFLEWLENIREWCVSRQLWWGHRIPVYYTEDGEPFAALSWEDAQAKAGDRPIIRQDDDVLDTWFSSGLWPFATLGWPEKTADLATFYPTSVLVTDRNIINLWVARMAMMGYDLTGRKPFSDVMIYATVLNEKGQRMSKSLGTGVDPMGVIDSKGADALRWTLLSQTGANQDLRYSEKKTDEARNWGNKIWNAVRFVLMHPGSRAEYQAADLTPIDLWLRSRLARTEQEVRAAYDGYDLQLVCQTLQRFFWSEVCDWYIEISKPRLADPSQASIPRALLVECIDAFLRMLHPIMPHLTEEVWQYLRGESGDYSGGNYLMGSIWPTISPDIVNVEVESRVERAFEVTRSLRALRASLGVAAMTTVPLAYFEGPLEGLESVVASQAWVSELVSGKPEGRSISSTVAGIDLYLSVEGLVDVEKELARLEKEIVRLTDELGKMEIRLQNPAFVERAKPEAVEKAHADIADLRDRLEKARLRQELFA